MQMQRFMDVIIPEGAVAGTVINAIAPDGVQVHVS